MGDEKERGGGVFASPVSKVTSKISLVKEFFKEENNEFQTK